MAFAIWKFSAVHSSNNLSLPSTLSSSSHVPEALFIYSFYFYYVVQIGQFLLFSSFLSPPYYTIIIFLVLSMMNYFVLTIEYFGYKSLDLI